MLLVEARLASACRRRPSLGALGIALTPPGAFRPPVSLRQRVDLLKSASAPRAVLALLEPIAMNGTDPGLSAVDATEVGDRSKVIRESPAGCWPVEPRPDAPLGRTVAPLDEGRL